MPAIDPFEVVTCPVHLQNLKTMEAYFECFPDRVTRLRPHPRLFADGSCHCANCFEPVPALRCGAGRTFVHHEFVRQDVNVSRFEVNDGTRHHRTNFAELTWRHEHSPKKAGESGPDARTHLLIAAT
jgi:hypothetical protein